VEPVLIHTAVSQDIQIFGSAALCFSETALSRWKDTRPHLGRKLEVNGLKASWANVLYGSLFFGRLRNERLLCRLGVFRRELQFIGSLHPSKQICLARLEVSNDDLT
jgi:hypothetical protein